MCDFKSLRQYCSGQPRIDAAGANGLHQILFKGPDGYIVAVFLQADRQSRAPRAAAYYSDLQ